LPVNTAEEVAIWLSFSYVVSLLKTNTLLKKKIGVTNSGGLQAKQHNETL